MGDDMDFDDDAACEGDDLGYDDPEWGNYRRREDQKDKEKAFKAALRGTDLEDDDPILARIEDEFFSGNITETNMRQRIVALIAKRDREAAAAERWVHAAAVPASAGKAGQVDPSSGSKGS